MYVPDHVSHSHFYTLQQCELRWKLKYLDKMPEKKGVFQFLGLTVHHVLDLINRGVVQADPVSVKDAYVDAWMKRIVFAPNIPTWEEIDWGRKATDKAENQANIFFRHGHELLQTYLKSPEFMHTRPMIWTPEGGDSIPLSEFQLDIPLKEYGGKALETFVARIDLVTSEGILLDYKTKNFKRLSQDDFAHDMQPILYAWGLDEMGMVQVTPANPLVFRYGQLIYGDGPYKYDQSIGGKIQAWQVDVMRQIVIPGLVKRAEEHIEHMGEKVVIRPGAHCKNCDFRKLCPMFSKEMLTQWQNT